MNNFITLEIIGINEDKNIKEMVGTKKNKERKGGKRGRAQAQSPRNLVKKR